MYIYIYIYVRIACGLEAPRILNLVGAWCLEHATLFGDGSNQPVLPLWH